MPQTLRGAPITTRTDPSGTGRGLPCRMDSLEKPTRRRRGLVAAALAVWVAVVVVGAGRGTDDSLLGVDHLDAVWIVVLVLVAVLGLVLLILLNPFGKEWNRPVRQRRGGTWVVLLLAMAVLVWRPELLDGIVDEEQPETAGQVFDSDAAGDVDEVAVETVAQASDLLLLLMVLGAGAAVWLWLRRRVAAPDAEDETVADEVVEADLIDALRTLSGDVADADDPRQAVLHCYAVLESVLASQGMRRQASETPTEHLRRALLSLRADPDPFVRLGELYEIARFADRTITPEHQRAAAGALDEARRTLMSRT